MWACATVSSTVAVTSSGESLKWWSIDGPTATATAPDRVIPTAHRAAITSLATPRNKSLLATSSLDGHVKVWGAADGAELKDVHVGPLESWALAFEASAPDDTPIDQLRVATTCQSGAAALSLWSLADAAKVATYGSAASAAQAATVAIAYSPDGRLVASAAMDGSVSLFDANAGTKRHTFAAHAMPVRALAFSADNSTLITASDDAQIRVHDVESCSPIVSLSVSFQNVIRFRVSFSSLIIIALFPLRLPSQGHTSWVLALANSPDRKRFASGSADKTVRIWDVGNRKRKLFFFEGCFFFRINAFFFFFFLASSTIARFF